MNCNIHQHILHCVKTGMEEQQQFEIKMFKGGGGGGGG